MAKSVTINGTEYKSSVQAAKALVASGSTVAQATKTLNEAGSTITYQSVYAYTVGMSKTGARRAKYRILALGKSGRKTVSEIADKTSTSTSKVVAMLKKAQIAVITKEAIAKAKAEAKAAKQSAKDAKKAERDAAKAVKVAKKAAVKSAKPAKNATKKTTKVKKVVEVPVVIEDVLKTEEEMAAEMALADMAMDGELN